MVVTTRVSMARNAWRMFITPTATMAAAPHSALTTMGRIPDAANKITAPKISVARLAWITSGSSSCDHSSSTTSRLLLSFRMSSGWPCTRSSSPGSSRMSVIRERYTCARRWMPRTTQWVWYRKPAFERVRPARREPGATMTSANIWAPNRQRPPPGPSTSAASSTSSSGWKASGSSPRDRFRASRVAATTRTSPTRAA